jgi:hypothetical protein
VVPWQDVLHEGPVPEGLNPAELRNVRANFIASAGWSVLADVLHRFQVRDAALIRLEIHDEIVLWFEHDLYDQLQLLQAMERVVGHDNVTLICNAEYLGRLESAQLKNRFEERVRLRAEHFNLAGYAWSAFRSRDPRDIEAVLRDDLSLLPFLASALQRHLEQFPSVQSGLSRSERQILEVLVQGDCSLKDLYHRSHHEREEAIFLGDTVFLRYLHNLRDVAEPLLKTKGDDWNSIAALTEMGSQVLSGRADHVRLNGIDRWLGGTHLRGNEAAFRWDATSGTLLETRE